MKKHISLSLFFAFISLSIFCQNSRIFFQSEIMAVREGIDKKDSDEALRHLNKAKQYAGAEDKTELAYYDFQVQKLANNYAAAEKALDEFLAQKPDLEKGYPGIAEEIAAIRNASFEQKRGEAASREDESAWAATDKNSVENLHGYLKNYPKGAHADEAKQLMGKLAVKNRLSLSSEQMNLLKEWRFADTHGAPAEDVFSLVAQQIRDYRKFPNLLVLEVSNEPWLKNDESVAGLKMPMFYPKGMLHDVLQSRLQAINIHHCRFYGNRFKDKLTSPHLTYLRIAHCELYKLGDLELPNLHTLYVFGNHLRKLPNLSRQTLSSLKYIDLSQNDLKKFPDEVLDCPNLTSLTLWKNPFTEVPAKISRLQKLEYLDLTWNPIAELPPQLFTLKNLKELYLWGTKIKRLPVGIQNLEKLEKLGLGGDLEQLPGGMEQLTSLRELYLIDVARLKDFPDELENFKKLEVLFIRKNPWKKVPEGIAKLRRIKELHLVDFGLTGIPEVIFQLRNLKKLDLSNNPLASVGEVKELAFLEKLDLSDCKLDGASLVKLRCELPTTEITYFDPQLKKNVTSRLIDSISLTEFADRYRFFLEDDVEMGYHLGQYFARRGDVAIAYHIFKTCAGNQALEGKFKALLNQLAIAEMFEKQEKPEEIIQDMGYDNWRNGTDNVLKSNAFQAFDELCNCTPRDQKSNDIAVSGCNKVLDLQFAVREKLQGVAEDAENILGYNAMQAEQKMANAQSWVDLGASVTNSGADKFTGVGALAGSVLGYISESNAEQKMNIAQRAKTTIENVAEKINWLDKEIENTQRTKKRLER